MKEKDYNSYFFAIILVLCISILALIFYKNFSDNNKKKMENSTEVTHTKNTQTGGANIELNYSNLADAESQDEVKDALQNAGIDEKNISEFFANVDDFNRTVGSGELTTNFTKIPSLTTSYNLEEMQEKWQQNHSDFPGLNCRITSYSLLRNFVKITKNTSLDTSNLFLDDESINSDRHIFDDTEKQIFNTLFAQIPTNNSLDVSAHIENAKNTWKERGVEFIYRNDKTKASFISVFFHDNIDENKPFLFIGHIGILLPTTDGKIFFIEKLAFQAPYQAIKFNNRQELNNYLMNMYDTDYSGTAARPFVLENDELLDGYQLNLQK